MVDWDGYCRASSLTSEESAVAKAMADRGGVFVRGGRGVKACVFAKRTQLQLLQFMWNSLSRSALAFAGWFLQMGLFSTKAAFSAEAPASSGTAYNGLSKQGTA